MNFAEGPLLGVAARVAHGLSCYPDPRPIPYMINPYGPVAYYLFAGVVKIFGVNLTAPRIFVGAATFWCALVISLLVRHWTGSVKVGVAFGSLFLIMPAVLQWMAMFRVDLIGLAFALTGLFFFVTSKRWFTSVPFFVAAFFCKFTFAAAPTACVIYFLSRKDWRKAIGFAGLWAVLAGVAFLACQRLTQGWFAFHTILASSVHPFAMEVWAEWTLDELNYALVPFLLTIALFFRRGSRDFASLPFIYVVLASLSTILRGKLGADSNYYLEWEAALCICLGVKYGQLKTGKADSGVARALVPFFLGCWILAVTHWINFDNDASLRASRAECREAYQFVSDHHDNRILTENVGALVLAGAPPVVFEPFLWGREVLDGKWSDSEVLDLIRSRSLPLILVDRNVERAKSDSYPNLWPRAVLESIEQNYALVGGFKCKDANYVYSAQPSPKLLSK
jgi:hypothetical protein